MTGLGLNAQACKRALDDAGLTLKDVDGVLTAYTMTEPYFMLGTVVAEYLGIQPRYCASVAGGGLGCARSWIFNVCSKPAMASSVLFRKSGYML